MSPTQHGDCVDAEASLLLGDEREHHPRDRRRGSAERIRGRRAEAVGSCRHPFEELAAHFAGSDLRERVPILGVDSLRLRYGIGRAIRDQRGSRLATKRLNLLAAGVPGTLGDSCSARLRSRGPQVRILSGAPTEHRGNQDLLEREGESPADLSAPPCREAWPLIRDLRVRKRQAPAASSALRSPRTPARTAPASSAPRGPRAARRARRRRRDTTAPRTSSAAGAPARPP